MKKYTVYVRHRAKIFNAQEIAVKRDIEELLQKKISTLRIANVYEISGMISRKKIKEIANRLLLDSLTQVVSINRQPFKTTGLVVEVFYKDGVTDSVGEIVQLGITDLGIDKVKSVRTGKVYFLKGEVSVGEVKKIAEKVLANTVIQNYFITNG